MNIAIDCDLRKIYCVTSDGVVVAKSAPSIEPIIRFIQHNRPSEVLFEVASAVSAMRGGESSATMYQLARWIVFNAATAAQLNATSLVRPKFAPSDKWTKGHDIKVRHLVARCTQPERNLRECEAMLWYHKHHPSAWVHLEDYLGGI